MTHAFQGNYQNKINQALCFIFDQLIQNKDCILLFPYLLCARNSVKVYYINPVWQLLISLHRKTETQKVIWLESGLEFKAKSADSKV